MSCERHIPARLFEITFEHPPGSCRTDIWYMTRQYTALDLSDARGQTEGREPICEECGKKYHVATVIRA